MTYWDSIRHALWGKPRSKAELDEAIASVENYLDVHRWDLLNTALIAGLLALAFASVGLGTEALIWAAAVFAAEVAFFLVRMKISRTKTTIRNVHQRISLLQICSFGTLLVWAPGLLFGMGKGDPLCTTLVLLAWSGSLIVVTNQNGAIPRIAITSGAVPGLLIMFVPALYAERPADIALAGLAIVLVILVARNTIANLRLSRDVFAVQADKDELIGELEIARQAAEADRRRADQANKAKTEFLAIMSHEIRTPMNGMLGMGQMLLRGDLSEEQRSYAETIVQSGDNLLALLNDTLDLSRIESGRMSLDAEEEDPRRIIEGIEALWAPRARDEGLEFTVEIDASVPARAELDSRKVQQLLTNLVGNAVKFTSKGSVIIRATAPQSGKLRFEVEDTGPGIPAEAHKRIFEKFTQADASTSRSFGGTGLGLTLCQEFAQLMGGSIKVASQEGKGSTFSVEIPCRFFVSDPEPEVVDDIVATGGADDPLDSRNGELRVLVADDHPINQKLMRAFIERFGFQYEVVENGRQAVDAVAYGNFDVVLMDVQMPEMDGITATAEIRKLPNGRGSIPVLAITANAMVGQREAYLAQGFDGYISKPIDTALLRDEILRVTKARNSAQASDTKTAASA
ncbi:MAG: ATP-binding protein [Candidatus Phaeomarinobacter sp.]